MVECNFGKGNVIMFASTADRDGNNMVSRPLFVPFMQSLTRYVSGTSSKTEAALLRVGDTFRCPRLDNAVVAGPDGSQKKAVIQGDELICSEIEEPGIYEVRSGGKTVRHFAVNMDTLSGEGDLHVMSKGGLKNYFQDNPVVSISMDNWEKTIISVLSGTDISRMMLAIVLFLLLGEVMLANPLRTQK
jgi:hypothetical protein